MKKLISINFFAFIITFISLSFCFQLSAQDISIKIHLRGVYDSKISLMPLAGANALKPIIEKTGTKNGETAVLSVSKDMLPGEFVLRFDYKEKESSTPYPSEKHIIIYNQNLELWVNPPFCNNNDSTYFQKDEKENTFLAQFSTENSKRKDKLGLLYNFLMNYDDIQSTFYKLGVEEYEKRRLAYDQWLTEQSNKQKALFVSHTLGFQYIPKISFDGNEADRVQSVITHYFDGVDFTDSLLLNTAELKEWMNSYVNIFGAMAVTETLRDSLFTLAGKLAIDKASLGHPRVYGWMVDYFYNGYESYNIQSGLALLKQHIENPKCLTSKRQQIIKRLDGMAKLTVGVLAPNFNLTGTDGSNFDFHAYKGKAKYKLLLFWSADCEHCQLLVKELKQWYYEGNNKDKLDIIAVSLDDTEEGVQKWESTIKTLPGWHHFMTTGGVNSAVANTYALLSTPVMFLVENKTNIIKGTPDKMDKLIKELDQ